MWFDGGGVLLRHGLGSWLIILSRGPLLRGRLINPWDLLQPDG